MPARKIILSILLVVILLSATIFLLRWHTSQKPLPVKKIHVKTVQVTMQAMPIEFTFPGQIEAINSVDVTAEATGVIQKINFVPGQRVKTGQLLFQLDPAPFIAKLDQAKQDLIKDQAQWRNTLLDQKRLQTLVQKGYVSQQQYDQIASQATMQAAAVKSDEEVVKQAQIQLDYTHITAPISGKTGNVIVKEGDLVTALSTTPLVTINALHTVFADFNLPQDQLRTVMMDRKQHPITVRVYTEAGDKLLGEGTLTFVDNSVNMNTGTVLLKATIRNEPHLLWPSQLVTVKLILRIEKNAVTVPSEAVKMDDQGPFVYLIKNNRAWVQHIIVARQQGDQTVVKQGLQAGEMVVVNALPNLENGSAVAINIHR